MLKQQHFRSITSLTYSFPFLPSTATSSFSTIKRTFPSLQPSRQYSRRTPWKNIVSCRAVSTMTRPSSLPSIGTHTPTRTVLVLGASYAGHRAIQMLVALLPSNWKVVVLERNTHFNHLYAFPRMSVVPGHEHKIFVPYTKVFQPLDTPSVTTDNVLIHGSLVSLSPAKNLDGEPVLGRGVARYTPLTVKNEKRSSSLEDIHFDYLIYGLGSQLPPPINLWSTTSKVKNQTGLQSDLPSTKSSAVDAIKEVTIPQTRGSKATGIKWLKETQNQIRDADSILIIGAGALGVRESPVGRKRRMDKKYASDIAYTYGTPTTSARWKGHGQSPKPKKVTLLSSSTRILPRFQPWMHEEGVRSLNELGVEVITGDRADMSTLDDSSSGEKKKVKTISGREVEAELVLFCTGQKPNTSYLQSFGNVIRPKTGMASVTPYLQLTEGDGIVNQESLNHIFVIGDAADAFGALNAGHTAWDQAEVAARNVARLVTMEESKMGKKSEQQQDWSDLEVYTPCPHRIKVSIGLERAIVENAGNHKINTEGKEDLNAPNMWLRRGLNVDDMTV